MSLGGGICTNKSEDALWKLKVVYRLNHLAQLLKGNSGIFTSRPYVYIFGCVNDSYRPKVLEVVQ